MAVERLVHDPDLLDRSWERDVVFSPALGDFDDVFSLADADELISGRALRIPFVRMIRDGKDVDPGDFTKDIPTGTGPMGGLLDPGAALGKVREGVTLVLQGLQRYCPSISDFCRTLGRELGTPMYAAAYITPPGARGAGPHYDSMSVFIKQVAGSKRWIVREPVELWPVEPWSPSMDLDGELVGEFLLEPGDGLYLPRGYVHDAVTDPDSYSVHLTISGRPPLTWLHVLHDVLDREARRVPDLREALPPRFEEDPGAFVELLEQRVDAFLKGAADLSCDDLAKELIEEHAPEFDADLSGRLLDALTQPVGEPA